MIAIGIENARNLQPAKRRGGNVAPAAKAKSPDAVSPTNIASPSGQTAHSKA
jgi:hypothetical protein